MQARHPARSPRRLVAACFALAAVCAARPALACGGCFVPSGSSSPVLQDAERVLFVHDPATKKSTVWVEIRYNGAAADFAWVLPLPKEPQVGVGASYLFDRLDAATGPRFTTESGNPENCNGGGGGSTGGIGCGAGEDAAVSAPSAARGFGDPRNEQRGVTVLEHDQIGPYDYYLVQGTTAQGMLAWLNARKFAIPLAAVDILEAHVKKGDVFVAVKLAAGKTAKEIKPIALTMTDAEPCVPLRLTSIAAVDNTAVVVTLAGPGRAVPKSYLHVQPNLMKVQWFDSAANYGQVLAAAIDEAGGRAFATEFAGKLPAKIEVPGAQVWDPPTSEAFLDVARVSTAKIALQKDRCAILQVLRAQDFPWTAETITLLEPDLQLGSSGSSNAALLTAYRSASCPGPLAVDGAALAATLQTEFSGPIEAVVPQLQAAPRVSRLALFISPAEMTKDPVFGFHPTLPDVSNQHAAIINAVCQDGFSPVSYRLSVQGVGSYLIPTSTAGTRNSFDAPLANNALDPRFQPAPAAAVVELLDEQGEPRPIHPDDIDLVDQAIANAQWGKPSLPADLTLKPAPARWKAPKSDAMVAALTAADNDGGCGLAARAQRPIAAFGLLGLVAALVGVRRSRRRAAARPE